jgi:hypothetical protein
MWTVGGYTDAQKEKRERREKERIETQVVVDNGLKGYTNAMHVRNQLYVHGNEAIEFECKSCL